MFVYEKRFFCIFIFAIFNFFQILFRDILNYKLQQLYFLSQNIIKYDN